VWPKHLYYDPKLKRAQAVISQRDYSVLCGGSSLVASTIGTYLTVIVF